MIKTGVAFGMQYVAFGGWSQLGEEEEEKRENLDQTRIWPVARSMNGNDTMTARALRGAVGAFLAFLGPGFSGVSAPRSPVTSAANEPCPLERVIWTTDCPLSKTTEDHTPLVP